jgi:hypothetical protein
MPAFRPEGAQMDIGVPFRDLGAIDVTAAAHFVADLPDDAWTRNTFRQEMLADKVHAATQTIILRHEWVRDENPWGAHELSDLVRDWARPKGVDPAPFLPIAKDETAMGPVYTFREWDEYRPVLASLVEQAIRPVHTERGVIVRIALVALNPRAEILPHIDGQPYAAVCHRLHVPLTGAGDVRYKIAKKKFSMRPGRVYDFNNRVTHSVKNAGDSRRVNLFVDYWPDPPFYVSPAIGIH